MNDQQVQNIISQHPGLFIGLFTFIFAIALLIQSLYLKNLYDLLKDVRPENRKMAPGNIWFLLIGLFASISTSVPMLNHNISAGVVSFLNMFAICIGACMLIFTFYIVNKIAESIQAEYKSRNIVLPNKPTYIAGMVMVGGNTLALVGEVPALASLAFFAGLITFVAWIVYWVQTSEYKNKLRNLPMNSDDDSQVFNNDLY